MSKHRVLSLKPHLRLEWRGQHAQNETGQPDHSTSLGDSSAPSTRIGLSVHAVVSQLTLARSLIKRTSRSFRCGSAASELGATSLEIAGTLDYPPANDGAPLNDPLYFTLTILAEPAWR
jgi:hypothetical protein